jgi:hypothetical protein
MMRKIRLSGIVMTKTLRRGRYLFVDQVSLSSKRNHMKWSFGVGRVACIAMVLAYDMHDGRIS